jgi:hypothetical protein
MNAFGLNHCAGLPRMTEPVKSEFRNGRTGSFVSPVFAGLVLSCGVNGNPSCRLTEGQRGIGRNLLHNPKGPDAFPGVRPKAESHIFDDNRC